MQFQAAGTTIQPTAPHRALSLITSIIYQLSRNPIHLRIAMALLASATYLWSPWALARPDLFAALLDGFQIASEEHALRLGFDPVFEAYAAGVRRWP